MLQPCLGKLIRMFTQRWMLQTAEDISHQYITMEGLMEKLPMNKKKSTLLKTWKRRFFRAKDGWVAYFEVCVLLLLPFLRCSFDVHLQPGVVLQMQLFLQHAYILQCTCHHPGRWVQILGVLACSVTHMVRLSSFPFTMLIFAGNFLNSKYSCPWVKCATVVVIK